ncbi:hypothetical protein RIF29_03821 [Crotalaria pallida]|uniref:Uncharacterized protein n=1 Tax=Crotalaria pallida TaxID=3830 RepID=A0AAN9P9P0_CROPI
MAWKRGRPPKTPATHMKETQNEDTERSDAVPFDLRALDDADLTNLSPKKAKEILECIDALRLKIKGKAVDDDKEGDLNTHTNHGVHESSSEEPVTETCLAEEASENFE